MFLSAIICSTAPQSALSMHGVAVIVLRLLLRRAADHLADGVDLDLAADSSRAALLISCTFFALASIECRESTVAVKNASQLRSANAWPIGERPAFMMIGRVSP